VFTVHSALGPGLLESLYQKAMCIELRHRHFNYEYQSPYDVFYREEYSTSLKSNCNLNKVICILTQYTLLSGKEIPAIPVRVLNAQ
jgi:GxxExxY protein